MATRYLTALDYSDLHANAVLRKHAKKRPLGELESRYQYTPPQPVLSCRTVDIDLSGTRTYRPRSTQDILQEQQRLIRRLFTSAGRSASSAPPRRSSPRKGLGQLINGSTLLPAGKGKSAVHVQGRPCTSMSQNSEPVSLRHGKVTPSGSRSKTSGRLKNVKAATDSSLPQDYDEDMLETRRSHSELTSQIHAHWRPDSCHLNQGHFMRGQKRPDDVPPTLDAWLTFGGAGGGGGAEGEGEDEGSDGGGGGGGGVVDAFASFQSAQDYYNIEGSVGSRVAAQLEKGDRIRIGVNGEVFSHDLKVKKWVKDDHSPQPGREEEEEEEEEREVEGEGEAMREEEEKEEKKEEEAEEEGWPGQGQGQENLTSTMEEEDLFGDLIFHSLDTALAEEEQQHQEPRPEAQDQRQGTAGDGKRAPKPPPLDLPLSWDDQVSRPEVKVICARPTPRDTAKESLCETHPVVYNRVVRSGNQRPRLAASSPLLLTTTTTTTTLPLNNATYSLKQRTPSDPRPRTEGSKVKAISFSPTSQEDEQRLSNLSVDDVIQKRLGEKGASAAATSSSKGGKEGGGGGGRERGGGGGDTAVDTRASPARKGPGSSTTTTDLPGKRKTKRSTSATSNKSSSGDSGGSGTGKPAGKTAASASPSPTRPLPVPRPSSSVPSRGAREADLGIVAPQAAAAATSLGTSKKTDRERDRDRSQGGERPPRPLAALPLYRGPGVSSINAGPIPGDTQFIQISQPIRNPHAPLPGPNNNPNNNNNNAARSGLYPHPHHHHHPQHHHYHHHHHHPPTTSVASTPLPPPMSPAPSTEADQGGAMMMMMMMGGGGGGGGGGPHDQGSGAPTTPRTLTPNNNNLAPSSSPPGPPREQASPDLGRHHHQGEEEGGDGSRSIPSPVSDSAPANAKAISIPTGGRVEEEEEEELTGLQRRERSLRDQHIEHIATLLEGAFQGGEQQ